MGKIKLDRSELPVEPTKIMSEDGSEVILEFMLFTFHRSLVFGILDQTKKFRSSDRGRALRFIASNAIEVQSASYPELGYDRISLRGYSSVYDYDVSTLIFDTGERATQQKELLLKALTEWAEWLQKQSK